MQEWWRGALIYQVYPRSFSDSNGDGLGDLPGITEKLPYIAALGVDAIWISPFFKSPMLDFGYDIADYCAVDPIFGNIDDFKTLLQTAHHLNLKVIIDQVISHSSEQHAWFQESRQNRTNPKADWYVWADAKPDGREPNNWLSFFGGSAWTWEPSREQYYLHNFLTSQPDLNFHNPEVRQAQLDNMRFWLDLGVDGFRLDVANFYFHDKQLRDNPVLTADQATTVGVAKVNPYSQQQHIYDISQPENIDFLKELRELMDEYPERTTMGEINGENSLQIMSQYTRGSEHLHMAYTFDLLGKDSGVAHISQLITQLDASLADGWPCWALANHDVERVVTRWGNNKDSAQFSLVAMAMLISLRGSVCIYQGEELGLPEANVAFEDIADPYGKPFWPEYKGRDGCRTPMVWNNESGGGFSTNKPWLPIDPEHLPLSVSSQLDDENSVLNKMRQLLQWRQNVPALVKGEQTIIDGTGAYCWIRSDGQQSILCAFNLTDARICFESPKLLQGELAGHGFAGYTENNQIVLPPYQACFITCVD